MGGILMLEEYRKRVSELYKLQETAMCAKSGMLMAVAEDRQRELHERWPEVFELISQISDTTTYMIVHMYYVQGATVKAIAGTINLTEGSVRLLLERYREENKSA